jgi:hypothetical protein
MSTIPKTNRAACVVAFQKPVEMREVPIPEHRWWCRRLAKKHGRVPYDLPNTRSGWWCAWRLQRAPDY